MIEVEQLSTLIKQALDNASDVEVNPAAAREALALGLATAIESYVIGRQTIVTGSSASGGPVTGTGVIQ